MKTNLPKSKATMVQKFSDIGVEQKDILKHLNKTTMADITKEDVVTMRGVYNAINDGEQTVEDVFGLSEKAKKVEGQNLLIPKA